MLKYNRTAINYVHITAPQIWSPCPHASVDSGKYKHVQMKHSVRPWDSEFCYVANRFMLYFWSHNPQSFKKNWKYSFIHLSSCVTKVSLITKINSSENVNKPPFKNYMNIYIYLFIYIMPCQWVSENKNLHIIW